MAKKFRTYTTAALAMLIALPILANAQDINLASGGADLIWKGAQAGANAGAWMDLGDLSGDARRDLIVGAPGTASIAGKVYVIFGGPDRTGTISLSTADVIISSSEVGARFGAATAAGNILNLDNTNPKNLVIGAPGALGGRGAAYLYSTGAGWAVGTRLTTANANFTILGAPGDQLGTALATGDLDKDGHREIIVGAPGNNRIYIIKGSATLSGTMDLTSPPAGVVTYQALGIGGVLIAGDVTGDGIYDLLVGSPSTNLVFGLVGAAGVIPTIPQMSFSGANPGDEAGASIRILDLDDDGRSDLVIGAPAGDGPGNGRPNAGNVYVLFGPISVAPHSVTEAQLVFYGPAANARAGQHIATGDINRDTPNDIVILSPGVAGGAGELDVFYGRIRSQLGTGAGPQKTVDMAVAGQVNRHVFGDPAAGTITTAQVYEVTGEGARDIIVGVPGVDANTGSLYFTISPRMRISRFAESLTASRGNSTISATPIDITNPSVVVTAWQATATVPWLAATPSGGSISETSPNSMRIIASAASLAAGTYTGQINVSANSPDLTMTLSIAVTFTVTDGPGGPPPPNDPAVPGPNTRVAVNRTALWFGGTNNGALLTGTQKFVLTFTQGSGTWSVTSDAPWLTISPSSGTGSSIVNVSVNPGAYPNGSIRKGTLTINAPFVANAPLTLPVQLSMSAAPGSPAGLMETPVDNTTGVVGAVAVTGWALDDISLADVSIYRDPVAGESVSSANGKVFIGKAAQVDGARPDVDAVWSAPYDYQAGWGYMLLTNFLPNQGNGTFRLYAYATDVEGHTVLLGSRTITCDNAHATKPFGSIDTPEQGGTASGTGYVNFGWALGAQANAIPTDGSTITVFIDGVPVGHPQYNFDRADIRTLFPGHANTNGAVGFFTIDTTTLSNGVHTIAWGVSDAAGHNDGIGSRFFTVLNNVSSSLMTTPALVQGSAGLDAVTRESAPVGVQTGQPVAAVAAIPVSETPSYTQQGFAMNAPLEIVDKAAAGPATITVEELGVIRATVGAPVADAGSDSGYEGYFVNGGRLDALPAGSFLDRRTGEFFWHPGAGFVGTYQFVFIRTTNGMRERIPVTVTIDPRRAHDVLLPSRTIR